MNAKMRKGVLVSVAMVALLVMLPLAALADCCIIEYDGTASCTGFELHAELEGTVLLRWTASLERWDADLNDWVVEDSYSNLPGGELAVGPSWDFPADPPSDPNDGQWRDDLPDGEYQAVLQMWAHDGSSYEETFLGITLPCAPPTAVTLASFDADASGLAIELAWETAAEFDTMGFNVYRAESADGLRAMLNGSLIASQAPGSPMGATYQFVDDTARPGITYHYWLQEVDTNFGTVEYGPVSALLESLARLRLARPRLAPSGAFSLTSD